MSITGRVDCADSPPGQPEKLRTRIRSIRGTLAGRRRHRKAARRCAAWPKVSRSSRIFVCAGQSSPFNGRPCAFPGAGGGRATAIAYARVSTNGQDLDLQIEALKVAGCTKIYSEKISGAKSERPKLKRLLNEVDDGDIVTITRLDRLARSTLDLLHTIDVLTKADAQFRPWLTRGAIRQHHTAS